MSAMRLSVQLTSSDQGLLLPASCDGCTFATPGHTRWWTKERPGTRGGTVSAGFGDSKFSDANTGSFRQAEPI